VSILLLFFEIKSTLSDFSHFLVSIFVSPFMSMIYHFDGCVHSVHCDLASFTSIV
jgi:hypothetical protein